MTLRFASIALAMFSLLVALPAQAGENNNEWWVKAFRNADAAASTTKANRAKSTRTAKATPKAKKVIASASNDDDEDKPVKSSAKRSRQASKSSGSSGSSGSSASSYQSGVASYYWQPQPVASGGRFNPEAMTAAHKTLPFGTRVRVTRVDTGKSVVVTINDRGPYVAGRVIDLSRRAARDIGMTDVGITKVNVAILR